VGRADVQDGPASLDAGGAGRDRLVLRLREVSGMDEKDKLIQGKLVIHDKCWQRIDRLEAKLREIYSLGFDRSLEVARRIASEGLAVEK
jgi:hypothetical protein